MAADFRIAAVEDVLAKPGPPYIFNPDQGRQFTRAAFTGMLRKSGQGSEGGTLKFARLGAVGGLS